MDKKKLTKIVATISDRHCEPAFIKELYDAGMNVVRINTAHQTPDTSIGLVENVRAVSDKIALLVDTKGPEVRTKNVEEPIVANAGDTLFVKGGEGNSTDNVLFVDYKFVVRDTPVGSQILIDDGEVELKVVAKTDDALEVVVGNNGKIKNRKSINVPSAVFPDLLAITPKDKLFIEWSAEAGIDFIAHSFVRHAEDCKAVQEILDAKGSDAKIIAKIENQEGVDNIDEILDHVYGIMVARGDLGIEVEAAKIPVIQRDLIAKCVSRKKPVIVATQMLHTMIDNPRPTRAEVSDVANAIYSRTDAIMLSGETAYGDYPVEAVKTMASIAAEVEPAVQAQRNDLMVNVKPFTTQALLAEAAVKAAHNEDLNASAIVTDSESGRTSRYLSAYRPELPIYSKCQSSRVMRELALSFGVYADTIEPQKNNDKTVRRALNDLVDGGQIKSDDTVVYVGGSFGKGAGTSFMEIAEVSKWTEQK